MKFYFIIFSSILLLGCTPPKALFSSILEKTEAPAKVSFKNNSLNAESFLWEFGDGTQSSEASPSHVYKNSGNYKVTLTATKNKQSNITEKNLQVLAPKNCLIEIKTNYGNMIVKLFDKTPKHRDNFYSLAEKGYYNGLLFHRVIKNFMIQGGDPKSKGATKRASLGSGGPNYTIQSEFNESLVHIKGYLAAARTPDNVNPQKNSSGSQFYIVHGRKVLDEELNKLEIKKNIKYTKEQRKQYTELGGFPLLDMEYTVFGQIIQGLDVIDKIAGKPTNQVDRPLKDVIMEIRIIN